MKIVRDMFIGLLVCLVVVIPIRVISVTPEALMFNIGFVTLLIWIYVKILDTLKLIFLCCATSIFGVFHIPGSPSK